MTLATIFTKLRINTYQEIDHVKNFYTINIWNLKWVQSKQCINIIAIKKRYKDYPRMVRQRILEGARKWMGP